MTSNGIPPLCPSAYVFTACHVEVILANCPHDRQSLSITCSKGKHLGHTSHASTILFVMTLLTTPVNSALKRRRMIDKEVVKRIQVRLQRTSEVVQANSDKAPKKALRTFWVTQNEPGALWWGESKPIYEENNEPSWTTWCSQLRTEKVRGL